MQQTEKYKLNLIERNDPFSPDALNQNTQKIEDAMAAHEARVDGEITTLAARRYLAGTFTGNGRSSQFIPLPFAPAALIIRDNFYGTFVLLIGGPDGVELGGVTLQENGFTVTGNFTQQHRQSYLAFS